MKFIVMKITLLIAIGSVAVVAIVLGLILVYAIPTKDYSLEVDALLDKQSLFTNARVTLSNAGKLPITNLVIDYGNQKHDFVKKLDPGSKIILSPPEGSDLRSLKISADNGINITKSYREPIKLPGMIGS